MKRLFALSALLFCSVGLAQGKYRLGQPPLDPADYTVKVHISATHLRACALVGFHSTCSAGVYVDASLNGTKVELFGTVDNHQSSLIVPGDYSAMLTEKAHDGGNAALGQMYYVLLPDKSAWSCAITGFSE